MNLLEKFEIQRMSRTGVTFCSCYDMASLLFLLWSKYSIYGYDCYAKAWICIMMLYRHFEMLYLTASRPNNLHVLMLDCNAKFIVGNNG